MCVHPMDALVSTVSLANCVLFILSLIPSHPTEFQIFMVYMYNY